MKTAMQELIETIDTIVKLLPNEAIGAKNQAIIIKTKAESLVEKEKEQIIEAYDRGFEDVNGEIYYRETFIDNVE